MIDVRTRLFAHAVVEYESYEYKQALKHIDSITNDTTKQAKWWSRFATANATNSVETEVGMTSI